MKQQQFQFLKLCKDGIDGQKIVFFRLGESRQIGIHSKLC